MHNSQVTLIAAIVGLANPLAGLGGTEFIYNLFEECREGERRQGLCLAKDASPLPILQSLGFLMIAKSALSIMTFGMRVPAGIFIPTMGASVLFS